MGREEGISMDCGVVGESCVSGETGAGGDCPGVGGGVESGEVFKGCSPGGGGVDEGWVEGDSRGRGDGGCHFCEVGDGWEVR